MQTHYFVKEVNLYITIQFKTNDATHYHHLLNLDACESEGCNSICIKWMGGECGNANSKYYIFNAYKFCTNIIDQLCN